MADIVEKLKDACVIDRHYGKSVTLTLDYDDYMEAADTITALRAEITWHVADKAKWQDTQTAHLAEITTLRAEVGNLKSMVIAQEKLLRSKDAEIERLMSVVERVYQSSDQNHIIEWTRAAITKGDEG